MRILDLTHTIAESMPVYPGTELPARKQANSYEKDGFKESLLCLYSHTGTHVDPPLRAVAFWADSFQRKRKRPKIIHKIFFGR